MKIETYPAIFCGEYPYHKSDYGIDFWGHETGRLKIIKEMGGAVLIRESGQDHWSGRGHVTYANPRYYIGIYAWGQGHGIKWGEVVFAVYNIQYTKAEMKDAKNLALALLESLYEQESP